MDRNYAWYQTLKKPSWAPPGWLFAPVWTVLYLLIAVSFGTVFYSVSSGKLSWYVALPFGLNLVFNLAFTPIQFGLKNNLLAAADVVAVLATLVWSLFSVGAFLPWVVWANLPYLLWVCFATVLQLTVTYLNRKSVSDL